MFMKLKFAGLSIGALIGLIALVLTLGYLVMVGLVWAIQFLVNVIFSTSFDYNVWLLGLLAYIVYVIINGMVTK